MKITSITATPVNLAYRASARMSVGATEHSTRTIIEVHTDSGLTGLGDASYAFAAEVIEKDFAPRLLGLNPLDRAVLKRHCLPDYLDFGTPLLKARLAAWGGIDVALWDLLGKAAGVPVYQLLGGEVRPFAPFAAYSYSVSDTTNVPRELAAVARESIGATGSSIFEFKIGVHGLQTDIDTVLAVHEALEGRTRIAVDANMGLSYDEARCFLREVGNLLENVEEPVASLEQMQRLAVDFNVSISSHSSDLTGVLAYSHIDVVPTLDACGGITGAQKLAQVVGSLGRRVWLRSHAESGIGWAAMTHLGMSISELVRPAQSLIDLVVDDLVVGDPWLVRGGGVRAPQLPGLGVVLDRDALGVFADEFRRIGESAMFHPPLRQRS